MIEISVESAIRHQQAVTNASHLLSCTDYLIQALPEDVQDMPVMVDLTVLLEKVGSEISAARVRFESADRPQKEAPWRKQQQEEEAAPRQILGGAVVFDRGCRPTQEEMAETIKAALAEMLGKTNPPAAA